MTLGKAGYSLIEVLCAFAILATVLIALYAASGTSLHALGVSAQREHVAILARSKLEELESARGELPARESGRFRDIDVEGLAETRDVTPASAASRFKLQSIHLVLTWPTNGNPTVLQLDAIHIAPVQR